MMAEGGTHYKLICTMYELAMGSSIIYVQIGKKIILTILRGFSCFSQTKPKYPNYVLLDP